jgi:hypothetical protein
MSDSWIDWSGKQVDTSSVPDDKRDELQPGDQLLERVTQKR